VSKREFEERYGIKATKKKIKKKKKKTCNGKTESSAF